MRVPQDQTALMRRCGSAAAMEFQAPRERARSSPLCVANSQPRSAALSACSRAYACASRRALTP
jgi:hypothetical protein